MRQRVSRDTGDIVDKDRGEELASEIRHRHERKVSREAEKSVERDVARSKNPGGSKDRPLHPRGPNSLLGAPFGPEPVAPGVRSRASTREVENTLYAGLRRSHDEALSPHGIDFEEGVAAPRLLDRRAREGKADDEMVNAVESTAEPICSPDVGGSQLDVIGQRPPGGLAPGSEDDHALPATAELHRDGGADEARPSGHRHGPRGGCRSIDRFEDRANSVGPEGKDGTQLRLHDEMVRDAAEWTERKLVLDMVIDARAAVDRRERVAMCPATVGTLQLDVGEGPRRIHGLDPGPPVKRNARHRMDCVLDQLALVHGLRSRPHPETERGRRDSAQV